MLSIHVPNRSVSRIMIKNVHSVSQKQDQNCNKKNPVLFKYGVSQVLKELLFAFIHVF